MDTDRLERRYYSYTVSKLVTPDYPPPSCGTGMTPC